MRGTQNDGDGTTITWRDESWQANSAPYDRRQVETNPDGTTVESANVGDSEQVYDSGANTIYASTASALSAKPEAQRNYRISPGPTANTYVVRLMVFGITRGHGYRIVPGRGRQYRLVITASQAKALKDGSDVVKWVRAPRGAGRLNGYRPAVVPRKAAATAPDCSDFGSQDYGDQILTMLRSCGAHVVGHADIGGRDTLELRSQDGHITYYVDASSYAPVQLDTTGTDGGTSLSFVTWEVLPAGRCERGAAQPHRPAPIRDRRPKPGRLRGGRAAAVPQRLISRERRRARMLQPIGVGYRCFAASAPDGSMPRLRQPSPWEGATGDVRRHCRGAVGDAPTFL